MFDAWEQYRNVRPDYVQKLWSLINWTDVTRRFDAAHAGTHRRHPHRQRSLGTTTILRDASLEVGPGDGVGLVGPNGSGKTTLLRTVYRSLRPDAGTARVVTTPDVARPCCRASRA